MAQSHSVSEDGKVWTIALREGLSWHDGSKVLGRDCVASLSRIAVTRYRRKFATEPCNAPASGLLNRRRQIGSA